MSVEAEGMANRRRRREISTSRPASLAARVVLPNALHARFSYVRCVG